jgi:hypothetical protein
MGNVKKFYKREIHEVYCYREMEVPEEEYLQWFKDNDLDPENKEHVEQYLKENECEYDWEEYDKQDRWKSAEKGSFTTEYSEDKDVDDILYEE